MAVACHSTKPEPVDIESYDMCAFCRMAVSQSPFAAEIIDSSGAVHKFDDIGCMVHFSEQRKARPTAVFVVDYGTRQWLDAASARFIHSERLQTPMLGGFAAFGDATDAETAARKFQASVLSFSQIKITRMSGQ